MMELNANTGNGHRKKNLDVLAVQRECSKQACEIQRCLARSNLMQKRCQIYIDAYNKCVAQVNEREVVGEKGVAAPGVHTA